MALTVQGEALTRNQAARRDRVIEAAIVLASEGGYDAVQMREVAATAHVALGTIYRYFSSKDHLLAACQVEWSHQIEEDLARRPPRGDSDADRVVDVLRRATRAQERNPRLTAALVTAITAPDPAVSECQREMTESHQRFLSAAMHDIDEERKDRVLRILAHVWIAALLARVNNWQSDPDVGNELELAARALLEPA